MRLAPTILALPAYLAGARPALAQGCVMCRQTAAAGGAEAAKALDLGILVLLIPTVLIFLGILFSAFRHRDRSLLEPGQTQENSPISLDSPAADSLRARR